MSKKKDRITKQVNDLQKQIDAINDTNIGKENIPSIQKVIDHIKKKNPEIYPPVNKNKYGGYIRGRKANYS